MKNVGYDLKKKKKKLPPSHTQKIPVQKIQIRRINKKTHIPQLWLQDYREKREY